MTKSDEFNKAYHSAKTLGDLDRVIDNHLTFEDCIDFWNSLNKVKKYVGLDMRQEALERALFYKVRNHCEKPKKYRAVLKNGGFILSVFADNDEDALKKVEMELDRDGREDVFAMWNRHGRMLETF